jgi:uncharacterized SAM-binding protein YcdF (DUF218 family)
LLKADMIQDLTLIASYLARRDMEELSGSQSLDMVVLTGSCLLGPLELVAHALKERIAPKLLLSGGIGHSTQYLRDNVARHPKYNVITTENRAEADIMQDILTQFLGVDPASVLIENESTNCGANAEESKRTLDGLGMHPRRLLLIQDPTMQRRTHASFERAWKGTDTAIVSFSPFIPVITEEKPGEFGVQGIGGGIWGFDRFLSLIQGEIVRLRDDENGYGPKGRNYIDHVDMPREVIEAYERVSARFNESNREAVK